MFLNICEKITGFCQVLKEVHTKENWFFFLLHGVDKDSYSHHISNLLVRDTTLVDSVVAFTASKLLGSKLLFPTASLLLFAYKPLIFLNLVSVIYIF